MFTDAKFGKIYMKLAVPEKNIFVTYRTALPAGAASISLNNGFSEKKNNSTKRNCSASNGAFSS